MTSSKLSCQHHLDLYRLATPRLSPVEAVTPLATNYTKLSANVSEALQQLRREYDNGDLTEQGLVKRQNIIITPYIKVEEHISQRKLLSLAEEELADWISNSKMKQMSLDDDMKRFPIMVKCYYNHLLCCRAIKQWELEHGPWVS